MLRHLKLSEHHHSGRLRPHEHTSYLGLGIILLIAALPLIVYTVNAEGERPGPSGGSVGLSGTMPGKAPTVAANIKTPTSEQRFSTSPVTISGSCPSNTLVELFKNDIFAGSTPCSDSGTFSLQIDLMIGQNRLIAKVYDALNQPGPDSNTVNIYYDAMPTQSSALSSLNFSGSQLLLNTNAVFRGSFPNQELNIPISVLGGTPPFAVNVMWGDSSNNVISRNDNIEFNATHTYKEAGTFQVSLQASDSTGRVAFLTFAVIVNGQTGIASTDGTVSASTVNRLLVLWPLYAALVAIVVSFWLGEQREKRVLHTHSLMLHS